MKLLSALVISASFVLFAGCEQQSWEETRMFNQKLPDKSHGHHGGEAQGAAASADSGAKTH